MSAPTHLRLLFNADDFGYCSQRSLGILQALQCGILRSVSALVTFKDAEESAKMMLNYLSSARFAGAPPSPSPPSSSSPSPSFPRISIGLHFNLTEGSPACTAQEIYSLIDSDSGQFFGKFEFWNRLEQIRLEHVRMELLAQIRRFRDMFGFFPNHLDGHNHVHVAKEIVDTIAQVCKEVGITAIRVPNEISLLSYPWLKDPSLTYLTRICCLGAHARETFSSHALRTTDAFLGMCFWGDHLTVENVKKGIELLLAHKKEEKEEVLDINIEIMTHPGYAQLSGGDDFSRSLDREREMEFLTSQRLAEWINTSGEKIEVISWLEVGESKKSE